MGAGYSSIDVIVCISTVVSTLMAAIGTYIAAENLPGMAKSLEEDVLSNVLELEAQMAERKAEYDKNNKELTLYKRRGSAQQSVIAVYDAYKQTALENWLNVVETLCLAMEKGYFPASVWDKHHKDYVAGVYDRYVKGTVLEDRYDAITRQGRKLNG